MSGLIKGKLIVDTFSTQAFLKDEKENGIAFDITKEDAEMLASAYNACAGMVIEEINDLVECGGVMALTVYYDDTQAELNAARALLREVMDEVENDCTFNVVSVDLYDRAISYLDACDKPGEST